MKNRKFIISVLIFLTLLFIVLHLILNFQKDEALKVYFFDVGQGDAILISQGNQQLLIDGGKDGKLLLQRIGSAIPFWDRNIETVIITHPDQDHIGGLVALFKAYEIKSVIKTKAQNDSQTFRKLEEIINQEGAQKIEAMKDVEVKFAGGASGKVLYPFNSVSPDNKETNENSVVLKVSFEENKFLLTGDLPSEQERELIKNDADLASQVLKVGHHGSKYSSSDEFLSAVKPRDAIVSVGKNNAYGHPAKEALERVKEQVENILRTDQLGTIVYECNKKSSACMRISN